VHADALELRGFSTDSLSRADGWVFAPEWLDDLESELRRRLAEAEPIDPGVSAPSAPWAEEIVPLLPFERRGAKLYLPGATATVDEQAARELESELELAGFEPVKVEQRALAEHLEREGRLVRLGDGYAIGRAAYNQARDALVRECSAAGSIELARFRDLLGTSRRPAQLLLERFDADGVTRRVGDARVLRAGARATS
jgi:hypothetical protein